ncbi:MAG: hypothetical protein RJQ14_14370 [Marinoscillum sp.]
MNNVIKLALTDFKIIFRDPSLKTFLFLPILLFLLIVWWVPALASQYDFLQPYISLFLVVAVIENTQMFCAISSMVLIDEKETEISKVYGVVPLSHSEYLISRFIIPFFFTVLLNVVLLSVQPFYQINWIDNAVISILAALVVPVYVLGINTIVKNRMQGMVYIKAFNMIVLVPFAAFFVPEQYKHLFGIFPTHWLFQSIQNVTENLPLTLYAIIGFVLMLIALWLVSRSFLKKHFI